MQITLHSVKIRPERQRKDLGDLESLKASILAVGTLINPIVIEQAGEDGLFYLIAGERRYTAWSQLHSEGLIGDVIPATLFSSLDEPSRQLIELEENIKRKDLTWQEQVSAIVKLKELKAFETGTELAEYLGFHPSHINRMLAVWDMRENEKIWNAETLSSAYTVCKRESARTLSTAVSDLSFIISNFNGESNNDTISPISTPSPERKTTPHTGPSAAPSTTKQDDHGGVPTLPNENRATSSDERGSSCRIINDDFISWAKSYNGKPFNLIHLDFPYGINHDRSRQGNTATFGTYEDSEDIYKTLVDALLENQDHLISESAHCICWLSLRFLEWTKKRFAEAGWDCHLQPFIWHKSDNKGILADTMCGMRNVGEYALLLNRGRRPVIKNISNIFPHPTTKRFHASEKPLPVLEQLFSALCDEHSRVLDPTCGSGTSIQTALKFNAEEALGIELDADFAQKAQEWLLEAQREADLYKNIKLEF